MTILINHHITPTFPRITSLFTLLAATLAAKELVGMLTLFFSLYITIPYSIIKFRISCIQFACNIMSICSYIQVISLTCSTFIWILWSMSDRIQCNSNYTIVSKVLKLQTYVPGLLWREINFPKKQLLPLAMSM